jgi:hypothetical protein
VAPAPTARHVKSLIQIATLPGRNDLLQIPCHETDNLYPAGHESFLHGPRNGPAEKRSDVQAKQILGPVQRFAAQQDMFFPLAVPFCQHKDAPADVKDRRDTTLPVVQSDARHSSSSLCVAKHEPCRWTAFHKEKATT